MSSSSDENNKRTRNDDDDDENKVEEVKCESEIPLRKRPRLSISDAGDVPNQSNVSRDTIIPPGDPKDDGNTTDDDLDFVLRVADDHCISVSKSTSTKLQKANSFFRNAFRHGTQETVTHEISKPDWTVDTAHAILHLLTTGTCAIPKNYPAFKAAADQILLSLVVRHPISGMDMQEHGDDIETMVNTWKAATTKFYLDMNIRNTQQCMRSSRNIFDQVNQRNERMQVWNDLLAAGTVFVDEEATEDTGLCIRLVPETITDNSATATADNNNNNDEENDNSSNIICNAVPVNLLAVGSFAPLYISVYHACDRLSESLRRRHRSSSDDNRPACMALPLYSGGFQVLQKTFNPLHFLTIDTNNVPSVLNMTRVAASFTDLRRVLEFSRDLIAPVHLTRLCYLLVPDPSPTVLGKLIGACQQCTDNPGSLGWDLEKNQFCVLKTIRDVQYILDSLLDEDLSLIHI